MARRLIPVLTLLGVVAAWGCSSTQETEEPVEPVTAPLPTAGLAGEPVTVYPLTLIVAPSHSSSPSPGSSGIA
jgi:hypothetical protein